MASLNKAITKNLFETCLPTIGQPRKAMPVWNEGEKMFICSEYESKNGHRYYKGVRFSNRLVIVENVGIYHTWTYIDGIELYAFNNQSIELIQKKSYGKKFRSNDFVYNEALSMVISYLEGAAKMSGSAVTKEQIAEEAKAIMESCYKSYLDSDFEARLTQVLPKLEEK